MHSRLVVIVALVIILIVSSFSINLGYSFSSDVRVGLFYYVWYTGELGKDHWNGSSDWTVVDTPLLGFYNSSDPKVIKQHLEWFKELGIDFLIISWWGSDSIGGNMFREDSAALQIFRAINETRSQLKIVLMVEDFNQSGIYDFEAVYDYIFNEYASMYEDEFFELDGKPLMCWWNSENATGTSENPKRENTETMRNDSRFEARIVGHSNYTDWYAWRPCSVDHSVLPKLSKGNFTCIEPTYDDSHIGRNNTFDENYSEDLYDRQWYWALMQEGGIGIVAIYSWNEYHERSQIEPHTTDGKYVLLPFSKTYYYIIPEFPSFLVLPLFMIATLLAVVVYRRKCAV
jgi:hypothetical protein